MRTRKSDEIQILDEIPMNQEMIDWFIRNRGKTIIIKNERDSIEDKSDEDANTTE